MSWGSFLELFWEVFGVLGITFCDFRRTWGYVQISMILEGGQGPHQAEGTHPCEGNGLVPGGYNLQPTYQFAVNIEDTRYQDSKGL